MTKEKTLKAEYLPGGSRRQEMLDKAVDYLRTPGATQNIKHEFCLTYLKMTETEYLEALMSWQVAFINIAFVLMFFVLMKIGMLI